MISTQTPRQRIAPAWAGQCLSRASSLVVTDILAAGLTAGAPASHSDDPCVDDGIDCQALTMHTAVAGLEAVERV